MTGAPVFSADRARVDRARVHRWLSEQSYWARGRTRAAQDAAIDGSRVYGVYDDESGEQLAFARVVTDAVTFAWLCDARGRGIGNLLVAGVVADLEPLGMRRITLATADAHGLYAQFGFAPLPTPERWMTRGT